MISLHIDNEVVVVNGTAFRPAETEELCALLNPGTLEGALDVWLHDDNCTITVFVAALNCTYTWHSARERYYAVITLLNNLVEVE